MKLSRTPLTLLLVLGSLGCTAEQPPQAPAYQAGRPGSEDGYTATISSENPFNGEVQTAVTRIQVLPSDPFFQENYYPDSSVVDVRSIFGLPTVKLATDDSFEEIDAFYRERFRGPDGEVQGRNGRYHRMTDDNRMEKVSITRTDSGRHEIVLQM